MNFQKKDGNYYYLDQGSHDRSKYINYLLCTRKTLGGKNAVVESKCDSAAATNPIILINSAVTGKIEKAILSCSSTECQEIDGVAGSYYLNVDNATPPNKFIIECTSDRCGKKEDPLAGFYLNEKHDETNKFKDSLIECILTYR